MEKLWTMSEASQCLGVEEAQVEQLVKEGQLTGYRLGGQFLRFRPAQVEALRGHVARSERMAAALSRGAWLDRLNDVVYAYDFYLISTGLLAVLVVYLIVAE